jgi:sugar O-acyltransferase (sialic acid O-acetyltransferase NeuD family)
MSTYIFGNGGHALEVRALLERNMFVEHKIVFVELAGEGQVPAGAAAIMGIGYPSVRMGIMQRMAERGVRWTTLTGNVLTGPGCEIGEGAFVADGAILTVNARVGRCALLNIGCLIGHGAKIGDCSAVMPGAIVSGDCVIGNAVLLGSGCVILPGVTVGDEAKVGAGAVVTRDVAPGATVVGMPAREVPSCQSLY